MNLAEWRRPVCWPGPQETAGVGHSSSQNCLSGRLRGEYQTPDHQAGMRGRFVCHKHSIDKESHVSESQILVMSCRWRRKVVQALSPEAPSS